MNVNLVIGNIAMRAKSMRDILEKFGKRGVFTEYGRGYYQGCADGLSEAIDVIIDGSNKGEEE